MALRDRTSGIRLSIFLNDGKIDSFINLLKTLKECEVRVSQVQTCSLLSSKQMPTVCLEIEAKNDKDGQRLKTFALESGMIVRMIGAADTSLNSFPMTKRELDFGAKRVLMYGKELDADHPVRRFDKAFLDVMECCRVSKIVNIGTEVDMNSLTHDMGYCCLVVNHVYICISPPSISGCVAQIMYVILAVKLKEILSDSRRVRGLPIPKVEYTKSENDTWAMLYSNLKELYKKYACKTYLENFALLEKEGVYKPDTIPQLAIVSEFLKKRSGFTIYPVAGYLSSRDFLAGLAFRVFHATQYIRHPSDPFYSPEPDVCHELLGHVPMFACQQFAQFSQEIGLASLGANEEDIEKLAKLYFFTVEFGLCMEGSDMKVYGAGLLSSVQELKHVMEEKPKLLPLSTESIFQQECVISSFQNAYYVCDTINDALTQLRAFTSTMSRKQIFRYDPYKEKIESLNNADILLCTLDHIRQDTNSLYAVLNRLG